MVQPIEAHHTQMLKGVLEMCLLATIVEERTYGYALVRTLNDRGLSVASESSIYPALKRLKSHGFVLAELEDSSAGPARKYYVATKEGVDTLHDWIDDWRAVRSGVDGVIQRVANK